MQQGMQAGMQQGLQPGMHQSGSGSMSDFQGGNMPGSSANGGSHMMMQVCTRASCPSCSATPEVACMLAIPCLRSHPVLMLVSLWTQGVPAMAPMRWLPASTMDTSQDSLRRPPAA